MTNLVYFSDSRIALQEEVPKHPDLMERLADQPVDEFEIRLALIAGFCNILLDGHYTQEDIDGICEACVQELTKRRMPVIDIVTSSGGLNPLKLH